MYEWSTFEVIDNRAAMVTTFSFAVVAASESTSEA